MLIYALLIWLYIAKLSDIKPLAKRKSEHIIKIDIKNIIPATPIIKPKPVAVVKKRVAKPKHKKIIKKKIVKKRVIKPKHKKIIKKKIIKKRVIKPKHKKVIKKKIIKKRVVKAEPVIIDNNILMQDFEILEPIKKVEKPVVKEEDNSLASFLGTPSKRVNQNRTYPNRKIKKLYGSNFHSFTSTQKRFIENNLDTIQSITQRVLTQRGYPEGAGRTHQEGTNVVSFNLHPNGTISDLRLKTRIGYRALDDNTLSLIRTAYREYPYPTTTTRIIFYVTYSIYGY
ncbi:Ferric siderophore transport system, periplasmic binding protein TonB [hydrothermal vent metagenome]|uniref:Ferric siderophore transport system, periplasmic binding protein TonB n=1 Tax=hydrothermal vent metagenome TaxID=652676 RepID=A0A1W1BTW2_9ZZZZ